MLINLFKFLILLIAPLIAILWHSNNNMPTLADGATYLNDAVYVANFWLDGNISKFLETYFSYRGWRPTSFPSFISPFLVVSEGNILFASSLTHILFTSLSTFFIYKILRLNREVIESAIIAAFLSLSVSVFFGGLGVPLFSEIGLVPFILGTLYYLISSEYFTKKKESLLFALMFFLAFSIRPAQSLMILILPILLYFVYSISKNKFSLYEVSRMLLLVASSAFILIASRAIPLLFWEGENNTIYMIDPPKSGDIFLNIFYLLLVLNLLSIVIFLFLKKNKKKSQENSLFLSFSIAMVLIVSYWYPFMSELFNWIYANIFGHLVSFYEKPSTSILYWANKIFVDGGGFQYTIIGLLLFISVVYVVYKKIFYSNQALQSYKEKNISNYILLSAAPIPILLFYFSPQDHFRVISLPVLLLCIAVISYSFSYQNLNKYLMFILVPALIIKISVFTYSIYQFDKNMNFSAFQGDKVEFILGENFPAPVTLSPHPLYSILDGIQKFVEKEENHNIKRIVKPVSGFERVDTFIMKTIANSKKYDFYLNIPIPKKKMIERTYDDQMTILDNYDALFLTNPAVVGLPLWSDDTGPYVSDLKYSERTSKMYLDIINDNLPQIIKSRVNQSLRFHFLVSYLYINKKLEEYGWIERHCFKYDSFDLNLKPIKEKGCIFTKVSK